MHFLLDGMGYVVGSISDFSTASNLRNQESDRVDDNDDGARGTSREHTVERVNRITGALVRLVEGKR